MTAMRGQNYQSDEPGPQERTPRAARQARTRIHGNERKNVGGRDAVRGDERTRQRERIRFYGRNLRGCTGEEGGRAEAGGRSRSDWQHASRASESGVARPALLSQSLLHSQTVNARRPDKDAPMHEAGRQRTPGRARARMLSRGALNKKGHTCTKPARITA
jgi:hypothetical protein